MTTQRLPDFLVIGAAKAGTTTLHRYLQRHPGLFLCEPKEPEFFSRDEVFARGLGWYCSLFSAARSDQLCGEASTTYTRWPHTADAAARIAEVLPRARLVYLLRNPIDRAYSHYAHHMRGGVTMTFEEALDRDSIYVDCGLYMDQIDRYLKYYSRESLLCVMSDELRDAPGRALDAVLAHIGAPPRDLTSDGAIRENVGGTDHFIRAKTTQRLRALPGGRTLGNLLPKMVRQRAFELIRASPVGSRLGAQASVPPMRPETRALLAERFREPNARLAAFLGVDLARWDR